MILQVRTAHPAIILGGKDYYSALAPYLVTFSYEDNCDGKKADDLNFELADREGKFISTWMPQKGAFFDASIIASRWFAPIAGDLSLDCGRFWIDSIEFKLPEHRVMVKATSLPTDVRLKGSTETRGWEATTLKDLATQIAGENNMSLDWQADSNPAYQRTEQHEESALAFLMARATDAKLAIKIHRSKIVVFDEQKMEEAAPSFTLVYGNAAVAASGASYRMAGAHFVTKVIDTTNEAKVSAVDPTSGELNSGTFTAPEGDAQPGTGDKVNHDSDTGSPDSIGDPSLMTAGELDTGSTGGSGAALKAKAHVRNKNKKKDQCHVQLSLGNPLIAAGQTLTLVGVGQFDGKWIIESAEHKVGPEYTTDLRIRRCLVGY